MLVCTLPSPACMCSATQTRPFSTRLWIASASARIGANASPAMIRAIGSRSSRFQETRTLRSCSSSNTVRPATLPGASRLRRKPDQRARTSASSARTRSGRSPSISSRDSLSRSASPVLPGFSSPR